MSIPCRRGFGVALVSSASSALLLAEHGLTFWAGT